jgi:hypothetical protein
VKTKTGRAFSRSMRTRFLLVVTGTAGHMDDPKPMSLPPARSGERQYRARNVRPWQLTDGEHFGKNIVIRSIVRIVQGFREFERDRASDFTNKIQRHKSAAWTDCLLGARVIAGAVHTPGLCG